MANSPTTDQIAEVVSRIRAPEKVAQFAGCTDGRAIHQWIAGTSKPSAKEAERLLFVLKWMNRVADDLRFRLWLDGKTVYSPQRPRGPITPVEGIRLDDFKAVEASAKQLENSLVE